VKAVILLALLFLTLPVAGGQTMVKSHANSGLGNPNDCASVIFEETRFTQCIAMPGKHRIEMHVTGRNGVLYRGFPALASETEIQTVAFGMNGGMYDARSRPIGYYVERSKKLYPLNSKDGEGNFYNKPNGVFFGSSSSGWQVLSAEAYKTLATKRPDFGTQSGPMLVIDGVIHPKFDLNGASKYIRNAVGVDVQGHAHFVISDEQVSFCRMARMMRDIAKTPNALYLDGEVSALWNPATGRMDGRYPLGPLILVKRVKVGKDP
jgi:uncharacterized protein YigE (DUF2233 family)